MPMIAAKGIFCWLLSPLSFAIVSEGEMLKPSGTYRG
uniref:Uncharacterized protein n=1 Tax=Rhizophora mucronata TaxID=61149 RepID=A0A2P2P0L2_RHIMU